MACMRGVTAFGAGRLWRGARPFSTTRPKALEVASTESARLEGGQAEGTARDEVPESQQRFLQVGIVGVPNAGKSTLTNALVGSKVRA